MIPIPRRNGRRAAGWNSSILATSLASLLVFCLFGEEAKTFPAKTEKSTPEPSSANQPSLLVETSYRPGFLNPWRYPLAEIYLRNTTTQPVEWKRAFLNGNEIQNQTNSVVWFQFYPSAKAAPGQTVVLQICLRDAPEKKQTVEVESQDGQKLAVDLEPFPPPPACLNEKPKDTPEGVPVSYDFSYQPFLIPKVQITGVTFSWDFQRAFILFSSKVKNAIPKQLLINGKDCTKEMQVRNLSPEEFPPFAESAGMIVAKLPEPTAQGRPIHVQIQFSDGSVAQTLLRSWKGIFLDDCGVKEGPEGEKLRKEIGLDVRPAWKMLPADPACADFDADQVGKTAPQILEIRRKLYESDHDRPTYFYLCTATYQDILACYGQVADGLQINKYCLGWSTSEKFIELEADWFRYVREAARPHPWFWIPEVFAFTEPVAKMKTDPKAPVAGAQQSMPIHQPPSLTKRMLEPGELRSELLGMLGHAGKGITWYRHGREPGAPHVIGYDENPALLAEIKKINADIKKLEPILGPSLFISKNTIGELENGARQYTLWSGDEGVLVIVRNLDYHTDREPNDFGKNPRFTYTPKTKVPVVIRKPLWFKEVLNEKSGVQNPKSKIQVTDPLTGQVFPHKEDADTIRVELLKLDLGQILWIPTPKK